MEKQENRMMAVKTKDSVNGAMEVIRAIRFFTIQSSSPTTSLLPLVPGEVFTEYSKWKTLLSKQGNLNISIHC